MKTVLPFTRISSVAVIAFAAIALVGCSAGAPTGGSPSAGTTSSGSTTAGTKSAPTTTKTYTDADLQRILKTAAASLGVKPTYEHDKEIRSAIKSVGGADGALSSFGGANTKITPASCKTAMTQLLPAAKEAFGSAGEGVQEAMFYSGGSTLSVSTIPGKALPSSTVGTLDSRLGTFLGSCSNITIASNYGGFKTSAAMTVKKVSVSTDADSTIAFAESVTIPKLKKLSIFIIAAQSGNLFINTTGTSSAASVKAINAAIAAAK